MYIKREETMIEDGGKGIQSNLDEYYAFDV